jgi:dienelactone hydrolase
VGGFAPGGAARAGQAAAVKPPAIQARAKNLVALLAKGDYDTAVKGFDDVMTKALPPRKLADLWKSVTGKLGAFKKQLGVRQQRIGKYEVVFVTCKFADTSYDVKVVFNKDEQVTGLFFVPPKPAVPYQDPDYVERTAFRETEVKFGQKDWQLPGTLSLPVGEGPFPAVVLVHGSGPQDRDETIGPNKPFRDLAGGLASRGIAVLRYDKRTRAHGHKMTAIEHYPTVRQEVIDDALAAAALLRKTKGIDPKRVFVLGHSLGAMLVPQIGREDPAITGLLCLAGATRPMEDVLLEQFTYGFSLKGKLSAEDRAELDKIKKQIARLRDPKLSAQTPASELPLGVPAAYWLELRALYPPKVAGKFRQPILVLQGGRDYQVTMEDFAGWKKLLAGHRDARFRSYPDLNHLFMEGKGKATPAEYERAGHVARKVVVDVAEWVKQR